MKLNILHTNDIHSNYENFSKIVSKIEELKDENTVILDAGDFADFKRIELQGTDGIAALELLEKADYDAIAVGNNETFNGLDTLINMAANSKIPFLSCNMYKIGLKEIEGVKPSVIINKKGLKILIIGTSPDLGAFTELSGLEAKDYISAIREEVIKNKGKYDLCIVLSHLGMDKDERAAEEIDGIDLIIGGHFHILMDEPKIINGTIIFTSGAYGENLGLLSLEVNEGAVKLLEGKNINIENCSCSEKIIEVLRVNKEKAIDNLSKPLYRIKTDLWHDVVEENPITNLLADALRDLLKCDLGIINSGVINGGIKQGDVSNKKLLEISPSPLNPTYFEIQGKYLRAEFEDSLDSDFCLMDGKGPGFRGKYLGRLHVSSNVRIQYNGRKVIDVCINGEKLNDDKWYTVATSDYLQRGTGYSSLKNNRNETYRVEYIRDVLRQYIAKDQFVKNAQIDRWVIIK